MLLLELQQFQRGAGAFSKGKTRDTLRKKGGFSEKGGSFSGVGQKTGVSPKETLVDRDIIRNEIDSGGVPWATWDEPHGRLHHLWIITRADHGDLALDAATTRTATTRVSGKNGPFYGTIFV